MILQSICLISWPQITMRVYKHARYTYTLPHPQPKSNSSIYTAFDRFAFSCRYIFIWPVSVYVCAFTCFSFCSRFSFWKARINKNSPECGCTKKKHTQADERRKFIFAIQINLRSPVIIASTSIFTSICCMQSEAEREKTLILRKLRKISWYIEVEVSTGNMQYTNNKHMDARSIFRFRERAVLH